jgi:8-oxo-dGTP pyrophosphatase MutT (NUDIX family)
MPPPRILDPRQVPIAGTDAHLPALPSARLSAEALRARFARAATAGDWTPEFPGDGMLWGERAAAAAAVLIPLMMRADGLHVLLTRRTEHLRDHAGQISFPGGRSEPTDHDAADTALREAEEEVGLPRSQVEVLGRLPDYITVTGFIVTPVVALVQPPLQLALDSGEVAEAFEVPLAFLMTPAHHHRHVFSFEGGERQFLSMLWRGVGADGSQRDDFIWGATAAMLRNLYRCLAA